MQLRISKRLNFNFLSSMNFRIKLIFLILQLLDSGSKSAELDDLKKEAIRYLVESCLRANIKSAEEDFNIISTKYRDICHSDLVDLVISFYSKNFNLEKSFET